MLCFGSSPRRPVTEEYKCHSELNGVFPFDEESVKAISLCLI